jgi:hypothetical protein
MSVPADSAVEPRDFVALVDRAVGSLSDEDDPTCAVVQRVLSALETLAPDLHAATISQLIAWYPDECRYLGFAVPDGETVVSMIPDGSVVASLEPREASP